MLKIPKFRKQWYVLVPLPPAVFTLLAGNLRVEQPLVVLYGVGLLETQLVHLHITVAGLVQGELTIWNKLIVIH